jgi:glutamyl-tRNA reductase
MLIQVFGLNHTTAPLELREQLTYTDESRATALATLKTFCAEAVIIDTCNRSEIYALTLNNDGLTRQLTDFLYTFHNLTKGILEPHLYDLSDQAVVSHLYEVASGVNSLVVGEAQILGQVRDAFEFAVSHRACGPIFSALFRRALNTGKRAHSETHIGRGSVSLSSIAIDMAEQEMGSLDGKTALLIGSGTMGNLAARRLKSIGVQDLWVANRTLRQATILAETFGGKAIAFENIHELLKTADVVFTSTAAPHIIITYEMIAEIMLLRSRPICIVDIALPRDVDPNVANISGVRLIGVDDLRNIADQKMAERRAEICKVKQIVEEETPKFWKWLQSLSVAPTIAALHDRAEQIRLNEMADHMSRLRHLSPQEQKIIGSMTSNIVGRLLHEPTCRLKTRAHCGDGSQYAAMLRELFGLDEADTTHHTSGQD